MYEIDINLPQKSYPIMIKNGLMDHMGEEIKKIYKHKKIALITDKNVEKLYGKKIIADLGKNGFEIKMIVINPGEQSKSLDVLANIYDELLNFGITRGDLVIAFGGGVVGDLTGFATATLLRGIPFIQIPTSLLAQIDSSVGGKVAVNLPKGKNLVGNFYHPKAVFIDPELLKTLDKRFLHDGMAEVIKYGCIKDKDLFYRLLKLNSEEELFDHIEEIIYQCCKIKKEVVEKDELDTGERMLLNFGHTLGHAIEKYFNYEWYTHGEAVAIGMYHITKKSEVMGITKRGTADLIKEILKKYGLSYILPKMDQRKNIETIGLDKKNKGKDINLILLKEIGESFIKQMDRENIDAYIGRENDDEEC
ncbi:3-dehydroquinate synthase [Marinisporobacter balticus]|uniref:3-dehydroquinate synthase n=1 Tax=Marinisporobacter balticus TaxID=2018667 RepID=A0A4R2KME1_9FIRM|nr:3-dehydroquinate synthase [Marinisporobacter balticus]TCO73812.1 3-dehydroquinate synthase [Marinisporobacter balticus]